MSKTSSIITLSLGIACALVAGVLFANVGGIADALPLAAEGVWGFVGCGAALIVCGIFALQHKPTPKEQIENADERNQAINGLAAITTMTVLTVLVGLASLVLFALGQLTVAGVLVLVAAMVVSFVVYFVRIAQLQKRM